jgi:hypothetical protein
MKKGVHILLYSVFFLFMGGLSLWWLFQARTGIGTAIAILGLITAVLPYTLYQQHKRFSLVLSLTFIGNIVVIFWAAPDGRSAPHLPISHQFTTNSTFPRFSLANLIPEEEQFNLLR